MTSELRFFVPAAIRALIDRLAPDLIKRSGRKIAQVADLNPRIPERIAAGESYDVALTNPPYVETLITSGLADPETHRPFGRVPLAIGRGAGVDLPVAKTMGDVTALLNEAGTIAYTGAGTSGRTYLEALANLGLGDAVIGKSLPMGGGAPVAAVDEGRVELAIAPLTTILASPGVVPAAIFPDEIGAHIDMSAFLSPSAGPGAVAVLDRLTDADLDEDVAAAGVMRFTF